MKELSKQDKDAIRDALISYCGNYPSQNRAAESMKGVSAATVSQIINSKYTSISDDMFTRIAVQIGHNLDRWTLHESDTFRRITFAMSDAQAYRNVTWVVGDAGCGKTTAAIEYRRTHRNVFYILCSEDMKKGDFVREIARTVGIRTDGYNIREVWSLILEDVVQMEAPLLVFDEADKLTEPVFHYFISLYNKLEDKAGIVFLSTDYIKKRVELGLRYRKPGYKEFYSRMGRKYFELEATSAADVYAICMANGLQDKKRIDEVIRDAETCDFDLRRVKKAIHRAKRMSE